MGLEPLLNRKRALERNRSMLLLLIEKLAQNGERRYIDTVMVMVMP